MWWNISPRSRNRSHSDATDCDCSFPGDARKYAGQKTSPRLMQAPAASALPLTPAQHERRR